MDDNKNGEHDKLWPCENIDMKVYNEHEHNTVSTTTTLNSKCDQITSLAASPSFSHHTAEGNNNNNNQNSNSNVNNLSNGNDNNLIT
jgi:hypothetical protein